MRVETLCTCQQEEKTKTDSFPDITSPPPPPPPPETTELSLNPQQFMPSSDTWTWTYDSWRALAEIRTSVNRHNLKKHPHSPGHRQMCTVRNCSASKVYETDLPWMFVTTVKFTGGNTWKQASHVQLQWSWWVVGFRFSRFVSGCSPWRMNAGPQQTTPKWGRAGDLCCHEAFNHGYHSGSCNTRSVKCLFLTRHDNEWNLWKVFQGNVHFFFVIACQEHSSFNLPWQK